MENKIIIENDSIKKYLDELIKMNYQYIVKAQDKFLSGWGLSSNKKHVQLIACKTADELERIKRSLYDDKTFNYVNWCKIEDTKSIYNYIRNKTYTIRNDWKR